MSLCKIAICDDDRAQTGYLTGLVHEWEKEKGLLAQIHVFESAEQFLFQYAEEKDFDILLLDIEMGGMNGVELARKIRRDNRELQIIFITGYMEYIAEGYDVEALHYLLKPVTGEKLAGVLDRGIERLKSKRKSLLLNIGDETVRVPLYEIRYLEVCKNYVTIHSGEDYTVKRTLAQLEQQLDEAFARTGRSYIVNLQYVKKITRAEVFLKDGTALPLSRGLYEEINRAFIRYF